MIRRLAVVLIVLGFCGAGRLFAQQQESYPLVSGEVLTGEPIHFTAQGVVVKRPDGSFTQRVAWTNFTEAALKQLGSNPRAKPFVDQFLESDEEEPARQAAAQQLRTKEVPRLARPNLDAGIFALFSSPLSLALILIFWAANIYAAYEIALFRNYPWMLVCGIAAVAPVIGPVLFLCLPTHIPGAAEVEELVPVEQPGHEVPITEPAAAEAPAAAAAHKPAGAAHAFPPPVVYKRGQTTFNRRFFETKLANFMRMIPTEADKEMMLQVKAARGDYAAPRISRVLPNELCLLVKKGEASQEVTIPYTEINEVIVKHKDA